MATRVMPWGKHKGTPLENIPVDYLEWCVDGSGKGFTKVKFPKLYADLEAELERRELGLPPAVANGKLSEEARAFIPDLVKAGFREMSKKLHPDKGGKPEDFVALRELRDYLESIAK